MPTTPQPNESVEEILKMLDEKRLCGRGFECAEWHGLCPENVTIFVEKVKEASYAEGRASMKRDIEEVVPKEENCLNLVLPENSKIIDGFNSCRSQLLDNIKGVEV